VKLYVDGFLLFVHLVGLVYLAHGMGAG